MQRPQGRRLSLVEGVNKVQRVSGCISIVTAHRPVKAKMVTSLWSILGLAGWLNAHVVRVTFGFFTSLTTLTQCASADSQHPAPLLTAQATKVRGTLWRPEIECEHAGTGG